MTTTAAISQPIPVPSERGGRGASRMTEENAFAGLLSKMTGGNQDGVRGEAKAEGEPSLPDGEPNRRSFMWVAASTELVADAPAEDAPPLAENLAPAAAEAAAPLDTESSIVPPLPAAHVPAAVTGEGLVPQPGNDETPAHGNTPRQMQTPASSPEVMPQEHAAPVPRETVNVTVLKQETHFAPVLSALLAGRPAAPAAGTSADGAAYRPAADERAGGRVVPSESTEASSPGVKPLILSAVHAGAGTGRGALSSGGGAQRDGMPGPLPMNGMRGDTGARGADLAMPADVNAASPRVDATAGGGAASSAVQLIAERIASEAGTEVARASQSSQTTFLAQASPLKVLHIQLQPADMGTVTVRMSLKDKTLQLDLEVSRGETAQLLQRDKEALSSLLRSAGYLVEGMDVRIADPAGGATQNATGGTQAGPHMQWGGQAGSSHSDARSPGGRPGDGTQQATYGDERYGTDGQIGEPSRGGGVYV